MSNSRPNNFPEKSSYRTESQSTTRQHIDWRNKYLTSRARKYRNVAAIRNANTNEPPTIPENRDVEMIGLCG